MWKAALAKIAHGLLVGMGFAFALGGLLYGYTQWQMQEFAENSGEMLGYREYGSDASIAPGQDRNFKVSCSNCRDPSQPLKYDRYTIAIVDASYVRPKT